MGSKMRRSLVIDSNIGRAAGETEHPISSQCRKFLNEVRTICHRMVVTEDIRNEWNRHESKFSKKWRTSMARMGKLVAVDPQAGRSLDKDIETFATTTKKKDAMLKDAHLLIAAMESDRIVVSKDDNARKFFSELSESVKEIGEVAWVNPVSAEADTIAWLKAGAKNEKKRRLSKFKRDT